MRGLLVFGFGVASYTVFFLSFLYAIGFVGDVGLPKTIDYPGTSVPASLRDWITDIVLLGIFALQHSGMARRGFKRRLTRWLPPAMERSTYVLVSSLVLILLFWQWRPLPGLIWNVNTAWGQWLLYALFTLGWLLVLTGTLIINHFDLTGLRQVWLQLRGRPYTEVPFKDSLYYRMVRHPLMLGFVLAFWATPRMSLGHLLFALATTGYILLAVKYLEERDLVAQYGETYRDYQQRVPMLCPWPRPRRASPAKKLEKI